MYVERTTSGCRSSIPRIVALEHGLEIKDVRKIVTSIRGLADQKAKIHEREHDISDIRTRTQPPVIEYEARHYTISCQRQIPARLREFGARDVPPLHELRLAVLERLQNEQIRALVKPLLPKANAVHDAIAKC